MTGVGAWQKIKVPSLWFLPSIWEELSQVLKSGNVNFITFLKATIAEGKISWCCIFIWGKIIKVNFWNKHSKKSSWFFGEMNGVRRKCMTVCTGRARGVIQEVATDKIHQIAGEEQGGGIEGTLEFTRASLVYTVKQGWITAGFYSQWSPQSSPLSWGETGRQKAGHLAQMLQRLLNCRWAKYSARAEKMGEGHSWVNQILGSQPWSELTGIS